MFVPRDRLRKTEFLGLENLIRPDLGTAKLRCCGPLKQAWLQTAGIVSGGIRPEARLCSCPEMEFGNRDLWVLGNLIHDDVSEFARRRCCGLAGGPVWRLKNFAVNSARLCFEFRAMRLTGSPGHATDNRIGLMRLLMKESRHNPAST
jgi:hypothetical protein